jgi:serine/threonine protein phosphatase PrpC
VLSCFDGMSPYLHWRKVASGRQNTEDRAEVFLRDEDLAIVVADGAGGMRGGAAASGVLIDVVRAFTEKATAHDMRDADRWAALLKEVDATLAAKKAGQTTGVIVVVSPTRLFGVSVGDSEAWIIDEEKIEDLSRGQETPRLGTGRAVPAVFHRARLDGVLLVATDGLFKYASPARIAATLRAGDVSQAADRLAGLVQLPSGGFQDDVGIVVAAVRP